MKSTPQMPPPEALGGIINTLMSNPALLQNIKNAIGNIPLAGEEPSHSEPTDEAEETASDLDTGHLGEEISAGLPQIMSALGAKNRGRSEGNTEALLCALKPFLSSAKAERVDKLINLMRIGNILSGI